MRQIVRLGFCLAIVFICHAWIGVGTASATCDANSDPVADCLRDVKQSAKDVFKSDDDVEKSKSVGEAVGSCIQCASETIADKMRQFSSDENSK